MANTNYRLNVSNDTEGIQTPIAEETDRPAIVLDLLACGTWGCCVSGFFAISSRTMLTILQKPLLDCVGACVAATVCIIDSCFCIYAQTV